MFVTIALAIVTQIKRIMIINNNCIKDGNASIQYGDFCNMPIPVCNIAMPLCNMAIPVCNIAIPVCSMAIPVCNVAMSVCNIAIPVCNMAMPVCKRQCQFISCVCCLAK